VWERIVGVPRAILVQLVQMKMLTIGILVNALTMMIMEEMGMEMTMEGQNVMLIIGQRFVRLSTRQCVRILLAVKAMEMSASEQKEMAVALVVLTMWTITPKANVEIDKEKYSASSGCKLILNISYIKICI